LSHGEVDYHRMQGRCSSTATWRITAEPTQLHSQL